MKMSQLGVTLVDVKKKKPAESFSRLKVWFCFLTDGGKLKTDSRQQNPFRYIHSTMKSWI